jgi:hypothetical protein
LNLADLLDELGAAVNLPGALCKGSTLWDLLPGTDPEHDHARDQAIGSCLHCPALAACRAHLQSLPSAQRPNDCVVAGQVQHRVKPRHKPSQTSPPVSAMRRRVMVALAELEAKKNSKHR